MEEFLKKLKIEEEDIKFYLKFLGKRPVTKKEMLSIIEDETIEDIERHLNNLINLRLFIEISPSSSGLISYYLAIPPIASIIDYFKNIRHSSYVIKDKFRTLIQDSINKVFSSSDNLKLNSILDESLELKNDIEEESIIQNKELEDVLENLNILHSILDDLNGYTQSIKGIIQKKFAELIKYIATLRMEIITKIEALELKKYKEIVIKTIKDVFKENFEEMLEDFVSDSYNLIEIELNSSTKEINEKIDTAISYGNDFKASLSSIINGFKSKTDKIIKMIQEKNVQIQPQLDLLKEQILEKMELINSDSIDSIIALNNPVSKILRNILDSNFFEELEKRKDIWEINSVINLQEILLNMLINAQERLLFMVPKLNIYFKLDDLKECKPGIKIQIASSEAHTNSLVKKYLEFPYIEYHSVKNENFIMTIKDNDFLLLGFISDENDSLTNFNGFVTNFYPLIKVFEDLISNILYKGVIKTFQKPKFVGHEKVATSNLKYPKSLIGGTISKKPIQMDLKEQKQFIKKPITPTQLQESEIYTKPLQKPEIKKDISKQAKVPEETAEKESTVPPIEVVKEPKDHVGALISAAFDQLVGKLKNLKGGEFSNELEKIAEMILEKRGFSVTLHKIRLLINQYRFSPNYLNELDIKNIIENVKDWKSRLL
ncbi:MAG: hypothetical protein ACTSW3_06250, partial [Promethearchaeota archaeon]